MADYQLFGAETSPYSLKVRAALRYKGIAFDWVARSVETEAAFRAIATVPTVPLLVAPDAPPSQESSAILARLDAAHPEPSMVPDDPACAALALLLEDYGDEWLNKAVFQERWSQSPDREAAAHRVLDQLYDGNPPGDRAEAERAIARRMADRLELVGAGGTNGDILRGSFHRFAERLNDHLKETLFIFGGRPSVADFAIAGQLQQLLSDPTPGEWLRDRAPFVTAWCEFMEAPAPGAPFMALNALEPTLSALLRDEIAYTYLPWAGANAESSARRRKKVTVEIDGEPYRQSTQRHAAKTFKSVRQALQAHDEAPGLAEFLEKAGITLSAPTKANAR